MTKKERARRAQAALKALYPDALCSLDALTPFQLLVATRLSAQCTDARVNLVTPTLFARYPDPAAMAQAEVSDVEEIVRSCGFDHQKARDIVAAAGRLVSDFGGEVPDEIDVLTTLPGVGRKTANLLLGDIYNVPGSVVVDTHCIRISNRLGMVDNLKEPEKIEAALRAILPPEKSSDFCHRIVLHGRAVCDARKPKCDKCCCARYCQYFAG